MSTNKERIALGLATWETETTEQMQGMIQKKSCPVSPTPDFMNCIFCPFMVNIATLSCFSKIAWQFKTKSTTSVQNSANILLKIHMWYHHGVIPLALIPTK